MTAAALTVGVSYLVFFAGSVLAAWRFRLRAGAYGMGAWEAWGALMGVPVARAYAAFVAFGVGLYLTCGVQHVAMAMSHVAHPAPGLWEQAQAASLTAGAVFAPPGAVAAVVAAFFADRLADAIQKGAGFDAALGARDEAEARARGAERGNYFLGSAALIVRAAVHADGSARWEEVSCGYARRMGYASRGDLEGRELLAEIHPDDRARTAEAVAARAGRGDVEGFQNRHRYNPDADPAAAPGPVLRDEHGAWVVWEWRHELDPQGYAYPTDKTDAWQKADEAAAAADELDRTRSDAATEARRRLALR